MTNQFPEVEGLVCPIPLPHAEKIILGHGSGGKLSYELIKNVFMPSFDNPILLTGDDAASFPTLNGARLAVSTDSHVVSPLFFPGGDIGRLAICGTVNDVSMLGAVPQYLTAGFILEEGLEISILRRIVASMRLAADEANVHIIAGDTKVVQNGKADGVYINTTGIGIIHPGINISGGNAKPGDVVIVSGSIGDHGIAVLAARGELNFETQIESDVAPLNGLVSLMLEATDQIHVLRDPTRGGLATTLNEISVQSQVAIQIEESAIPVKPGVAAACEMLGFDPLYVANEGKLIAIVEKSAAPSLLMAMKAHPYGSDACIIGSVVESSHPRVTLKTVYGTTRILDMMAGELLPRIC